MTSEYPTPEYQPHPGPSRPSWWPESADYEPPTMAGEVVVGSAEWEAQETARLAALKPDGDPISKEGTL